MRAFPHWCMDEHDVVGYSDSEHERCPVCRANDMSSYLQQENSVLHERLRKLEIALEKETERCAKVAEEYGIARYHYEAEGRGGRQDAKTAANSIAALIRGRGAT